MKAKFKGDPIEFMPNYLQGDWRQQVVPYFRDVYRCTLSDAEVRADRERKLFFSDRGKSRLRFDEANGCWRGRKTKAAFEKFGL